MDHIQDSLVTGGGAVLAGALICTATAQLLYKMFFVRGRHLRHLMPAFVLFGTAQVGFFFALTVFDIGVVYMSMGTVQVMVLGLSRFVLHENIGRNHIVAVAMIVGGLIIYAR